MSSSVDNPILSVCVITYNHSRHLRQALDSILNQESNYSFEILVHDDASTDGTDAILREYEKEHPNLIRVTYEAENQYGKFTSYFAQLLVPKARGKYIALCEGDDFWSDRKKIQKQLTYMEQHVDCAQVCHAASVLDSDSGVLLGEMGYGPCERDLRTSDLLKEWNIPTASRVLRKSSIANYSKEWNKKYPVGDFPTAIYSSLSGYTHYMPETMSVYRYRCKGSWTERIASSGTAMRENALAWIEMLRSIDMDTGRDYHEEIVKLIAKYLNIIQICTGCRGGISEMDPICLEAYWSQPRLKRMEAWLRGFLWRVGLTIERDKFGNRRIRVFRHA